EHQLTQRRDRYLFRRPDVDDLPVCDGGLECTRDSFGKVGYVDEAPRLQTSAVQLDRLVMGDRVQEDTLRPSPPVEVLALTVGPEESEGDDRYPVILLIREGQLLVRQLRDGVRPAAARARAENEIHVVAEREARVPSVDVGRGREHELRAVCPRGLECG